MPTTRTREETAMTDEPIPAWLEQLPPREAVANCDYWARCCAACATDARCNGWGDGSGWHQGARRWLNIARAIRQKHPEHFQ